MTIDCVTFCQLTLIFTTFLKFYFFQDRKDPWKDLSAIIMEEKYKAEERRQIIVRYDHKLQLKVFFDQSQVNTQTHATVVNKGEEWRKISRILDKFLLIVFTCASLITTLW